MILWLSRQQLVAHTELPVLSLVCVSDLKEDITGGRTKMRPARLSVEALGGIPDQSFVVHHFCTAEKGSDFHGPEVL